MTIQRFSKNDLRCPVCLTEWSSSAAMAGGVKGCPSCKTALQPLKIAEDGYVKLNWQDIRVLAIYAHRWAAIFDLNNAGNRDALQALLHIIENLQQYRPRTGALLNPGEVHIELNASIKRTSPIVRRDEREPLSLKPGADGKIISPFFKVFRTGPPDEGAGEPV